MCQQLWACESFVSVLEYLLAVGNYLNQNAGKDRSKGFRLSSLTKVGPAAASKWPVGMAKRAGANTTSYWHTGQTSAAFISLFLHFTSFNFSSGCFIRSALVLVLGELIIWNSIFAHSWSTLSHICYYSKTCFLLKKLIHLFRKDALNWSKVTVKTFIVVFIYLLNSRHAFYLFIMLQTISNQIKSNHFYCHITTAQVPWWVKFLWACSRQCRKTTDNLHMDRQCKKTTNNLPMDRQCRKTALEHLQCSRQCKKKQQQFTYGQTVQKKNNSNLHMDRQCKKQQQFLFLF